MVEIEVQIEHLENEEENSVIFTADYFGCVHHRDRMPVLVDIKKQIK